MSEQSDDKGNYSQNSTVPEKLRKDLDPSKDVISDDVDIQGQETHNHVTGGNVTSESMGTSSSAVDDNNPPQTCSNGETVNMDPNKDLAVQSKDIPQTDMLDHREEIVNDKYLPNLATETEAEAYFPKRKKVENMEDTKSDTGCAIMDQSSTDSQSYSSDFSSVKDSSSNLRTESSEQSSHDITDNDSIEDNLKVDLPPLQEVDGATAAVPTTSASSGAPAEDDSSVYHIKWINFKSKEVPIITQNENGPCPLLAIMNVLLLKGRVKFVPSTEYITPEQVMTHLGDCILENAPKNINESLQLNYQQNMSDGMAVIHKLQTGLDVNVKFTGVQHFEYTPECILFDLLGILLYHGWLVDPQNEDMVTAVGKCSYNQLVEKIITQRSSEQQNLVTEALRAEAFLDKTASQLTYHGLCELVSTVKEDELCVFFRNNHFSTMYKHQNELFLLVTDQGFLSERNVVWETLSNVEGDGHFVDFNFRTYRKPEPPKEPLPPTNMEIGTEEQVDHDYLLAMSLQQEQQISDEEMAWKSSNQQQQAHLSDHELASRLQAEEDQRAAEAVNRQQQQRQQQQQQQQQRSPQGGSTTQNAGGQRSRERERDRDRDRERDKSKDNMHQNTSGERSDVFRDDNLNDGP